MALITLKPNTDQVTGYNPERIQLGAEDTVEGRVNRITSESSPLMRNVRQRSRLAADQDSNQRGVINTSMNIAGGIAAGENAVFDRATHIASQDASTSFQAKSLNQQAGNQAQQFTAGESNATGRQLLAGKQTLEQINTDITGRSRLAKEQFGYSTQARTQEGQIQAQRDKILQDFQAGQAQLERQFAGTQNAEQRKLQQEEMLRVASTEMMRQISGQNATFMDAIGQINSADIDASQKTAMIQAMSAVHLNNLNTTAAMGNYDIKNGQVVYRPGSTAKGTTGSKPSGASTPNMAASPSTTSPVYAVNQNNDKRAKINTELQTLRTRVSGLRGIGRRAVELRIEALERELAGLA